MSGQDAEPFAWLTRLVHEGSDELLELLRQLESGHELAAILREAAAERDEQCGGPGSAGREAGSAQGSA